MRSQGFENRSVTSSVASRSRDVGFQRRASNKLQGMATSRQWGFQRGRRASNKQCDIPSSDIVLSPNNIRTKSEETIVDIEWDIWFHKFISEACGWSDHTKLLIVNNPERMSAAVAEMETVKSYGNFPRVRQEQHLGGRHGKGSSHLAWDCANRHSRSSEHDKEQFDGQGSWWRRSPTSNRKGDGNRKTRNIDGGSSRNYKHGYYMSGEMLKEEHQGHFSQGWSHHHMEKSINWPLDRRFPLAEASKRPESLSSPSLRSAGLQVPWEKQGKQLHSWRRGERRKLH